MLFKAADGLPLGGDKEELKGEEEEEEKEEEAELFLACSILTLLFVQAFTCQNDNLNVCSLSFAQFAMHLSLLQNYKNTIFYHHFG